MLSLLYQMGKDFTDWLKWEVKEKMVDSKWLEVSGLEKELLSKGYRIAWVKEDKVERRKLEGMEVIYDIDEKERVKYKIIRQDRLTLMGEKSK